MLVSLGLPKALKVEASSRSNNDLCHLKQCLAVLLIHRERSFVSLAMHIYAVSKAACNLTGGTPAVRRVIYTTNAIESLNYQLRKVIKDRGHFPNDESIVKLLWLAICNIEDKRVRQREKQKRTNRNTKRKVEGRLVEGQITTNWKQALAQLTLVYPERINRYL